MGIKEITLTQDTWLDTSLILGLKKNSLPNVKKKWSDWREEEYFKEEYWAKHTQTLVRSNCWHTLSKENFVIIYHGCGCREMWEKNQAPY